MSVTLNPYLSFDGNARQAMEFYKTVFGGELSVMTFADMAGVPTEPGDGDKVMHSMLTAEHGLVLMGADIPTGMGDVEPNGSISLSGDDDATLRGYWERLIDGGTVQEQLTTAPWGDTFGMCVDRFGVSWLVNIAGAGVPPE